jgi:hypothetical protein
MRFRKTAIALGVAAALGTGIAVAQPMSQSNGYNEGQRYSQQDAAQQPSRKHHRGHGVVALLREEMSAGRLNQKEGALLIQKIKQMHAEKRAEREARRGGEGGQSEMQQPR